MGTFIVSVFGTAAFFQLDGSFCPNMPLFSPFFGVLGGWSVAYTGDFSAIPAIMTGTVSISGCGLGQTVAGHAILTNAGGISGSWTWAIDVEEVSTLVKQGRSSYWVVQDQPKLGGTISGSITFNGSTASFSGTITAAMVWPLNAVNGHAVLSEAAIYPGLVTPGSTITASIAPVFMGQSLGTAFSHTYSGIGKTTSVDFGSGVSMSMSGGAVGPPGGAWASWQQQVTKQGIVSGQVNAFEIAYPGATLAYDWSAPMISPTTWTPFSIGDTLSLDNYSSAVSTYGIPGFPETSMGASPQLTQGDGLQARINPASLAKAGETDSSQQFGDGILRARLKSFNALTIWQAPSFVVNACTSLTNWTNATLSGGSIQVDSASGGGLARLNFWPSFSTEGYRYLQIVVTSNFLYSAYNSGTTYAIGDHLSYLGVNYVVILSTTGNTPPNATYYSAITSAGNQFLRRLTTR